MSDASRLERERERRAAAGRRPDAAPLDLGPEAVSRMSDAELRTLVGDLVAARDELARQNSELRRDATRSRERGDALDASESRLRDLFEFAPIGYLSLDVDGTIVEANLTASVVFATSRARLMGTDLAERIARRDRDRWLDALNGARRSGAPSVSLEVGLLRGTGDDADAQLVVAPELAEWPGAARVRVAVVDRTALRRAERAARRGDRRLRLVADALPLLVAYLDRDLRLRFHNAAHEQWFEGVVDSVEGRTLEEVFGQAGGAALADGVRTALTGTPVRTHIHLPGRDSGPNRWVWVCVAPDIDETGDVIGVYLVLDDQTALRDAQTSLRRAIVRETLVEQRERRRVTRVLDEEIGQIVALANVRLRALQDAPEETRRDRSREVAELLERTREQLTDLGLEILPPLLLDVGFAAAAEWLCERVQRDSGIVVRLTVADGGRLVSLGEVVRIVLFRGLRQVLGEARSRRARHVDVRLSATTDQVEVEVVERGGAERDAEALLGLTARIEELGGRLTVSREPDSGLRTRLTLPHRIEFAGRPRR